MVDRNGKKSLLIETKNSKEETIDRKEADFQLKGRNYLSVISSDYIDSEGVRKVVLSTLNDREEVIAELEIRPAQFSYPQFYDGRTDTEL